MVIKYIIIFYVYCTFCLSFNLSLEAPELISKISDDDWEEIQSGEWLIGFFHKDSPESQKLENDLDVFALKCQEFNVKMAYVLSNENQGLQFRFLVTVFPKFFYIKDGVVYDLGKHTRESLVSLIKDKKWDKGRTVNFLINPFTVQMSIFSYLFSKAVFLYNLEDTFIRKYMDIPCMPFIVYGFTFVIGGTFLTLVCTCLYEVIRIFFLKKVPKQRVKSCKKDSSLNESISTADYDCNQDKNKQKEKMKSVRKRKKQI